MQSNGQSLCSGGFRCGASRPNKISSIAATSLTRCRLGVTVRRSCSWVVGHKPLRSILSVTVNWFVSPGGHHRTVTDELEIVRQNRDCGRFVFKFDIAGLSPAICRVPVPQSAGSFAHRYKQTFIGWASRPMDSHTINHADLTISNCPYRL